MANEAAIRLLEERLCPIRSPNYKKRQDVVLISSENVDANFEPVINISPNNFVHQGICFTSCFPLMSLIFIVVVVIITVYDAANYYGDDDDGDDQDNNINDDDNADVDNYTDDDNDHDVN